MQPRSPRAQDKSGYLSAGTIAAISTATGGAISIVRVSGPECLRTLGVMCGGLDKVTAWTPRRLYRTNLRDASGIQLDDALVVKFVGTQSYTGEDSGEIHLHGGNFIASRVLATLMDLGVRQALAGEFTFRAVRNGKMALSQAQATAELIEATNEGAAALALEKLSGSQLKLIEGLSEDLRNLAALGEVGIDFADQDVEEVSLPALRARTLPVIETLVKLKNSYSRGARIQDGVRVAVVGIPNAGKSSFFNALLGEDRSIVSEIAGTTRDVVGERLAIQGPHSSMTLRIEDTAGLRDSTDRIEKIGIERSTKAAKDADVVVFVVDVTQGAQSALEAFRFLSISPEKTLGIFSKTDMVSREVISKLKSDLEGLAVKDWVMTSAKTGDGIHGAALTLARVCEKMVERNPGEVLLTRLDQLAAVNLALEHMERAQIATEPELFASDIRQTLYALDPLIGTTVPDDILGRIFSEFCIGK